MLPKLSRTSRRFFVTAHTSQAFRTIHTAGLLTYFHSGRLPDYKTSGQGIVRMFKSSQQRGLSGIPIRFPFHPCPVRRTGMKRANIIILLFLSKEKWQTNQFFLRTARYSSSGMTFSTWPLSSKATTRFRWSVVSRETLYWIGLPLPFDLYTSLIKQFS